MVKIKKNAAYYVYVHKRLDNKMPFYVGCATLRNLYGGHKSIYNRAYQKVNRSKEWNEVVEKYGYEIQILGHFLDKKKARLEERFYINLYGRVDLGTGPLVNKQCG